MYTVVYALNKTLHVLDGALLSHSALHLLRGEIEKDTDGWLVARVKTASEVVNLALAYKVETVIYHNTGGKYVLKRR
jgi:hypothetical protein